jgi:hypothetical protein
MHLPDEPAKGRFVPSTQLPQELGIAFPLGFGHAGRMVAPGANNKKYHSCAL